MKQIKLKIERMDMIVVDVPTSEGENAVNIMISDGDDRPLAMVEFSAYDGVPKVILGHWPDGEEWVDVADVPLVAGPPHVYGACMECADGHHSTEEDMPGRCDCCGLDTETGPETR